MKQLNCILLFVFHFSFFTLCFAQKHGQARIDSLLSQLPKEVEDTNKVKTLTNLSYTYYTINSVKGIEYGQQASALAEKLSWKKGAASANNAIGINYMGKADYKKGLDYSMESLKIYEELDDKSGIGYCLNNIAGIYYFQSKYPQALDYYLKALKLNEDLGNKSGIARSLQNIGLIYYAQSEYPQALDYFLKALKINEDRGNKTGIGSCLNNIGNIYTNQFEYTQALDYYTKALKVNEELGNKSGMGDCLNNIGNIYNDKSDYSLALDYYLKALKMNEDLGNKSGIAKSLLNIGHIYTEQSKFSPALDYYLKSLALSKEIGDKTNTGISLMHIGTLYFKIATDSNKVLLKKLFKENKQVALQDSKKYYDSAINTFRAIGSLQNLEFAYQYDSKTDSSLRDYKGALESYKNYTITKDSIFSSEKNKKLMQLAMQYDFDKKHAGDSLQFASESKIESINLKKQKTFTALGFIGLGLVVLFLFFVYRNYTNQRKLNVALQIERSKAIGQKVRAERSEAFKQQFLANMSHEIRTPMNAVSGITDILLDKEPRPDQVGYLEAISKSSTTLLYIINDILDLSKIEAGKMDLETIDFSLSDILNQVKDTLTYKAEEKGLSLLIDKADSIPDVIIGDPYRLTQILINLGGNAVKFTERGSVELKVHKVENYKVEDTQVALEFSITDTGIGIPADKVQTLFENFTQVNSSDTRNYGGTGLGLSISKKLVELQGGNIIVNSVEGRGTTFSFKITYRVGSIQKLEQRVMKEQKVDGSILDGLRILIVDDNEYNRLVAEESIHLKAKVAINTAVNGQEAIDMVKKNEYDVILMDIQMPGINGYEASRYIRDTMKNKIPIIALTASVLRTDLDKCHDAGMNAYIPKPFKAWQLITTIADVTGRKVGVSIPNAESLKENIKSIESNAATDMTYLSKFCEEDAARMKKYIKMYVDAVPGFKETIKAGIQNKDMEEIALHVHSFKPKWMMMGMKGATELSIKIDRLCKENNNDVFEYLEQLMQQSDKSLIELKDKC